MIDDTKNQQEHTQPEPSSSRPVSTGQPSSQVPPQFQPPPVPPQGSNYQYGGGTPNQSQPPEEPYRWDYNNFEGYSQTPKKRKNKGLIAFLVALIGSLLIGVVVMGGISFWDSGTGEVPPEGVSSGPDDSAVMPQDELSEEKEQAATPAKDLVKDPSGEILSIPEIAEKVIPSVVGVLRYQGTFYEATGIGSGIILDVSDGYAYIVTNAHVVENGTGFKVRFNDAQEYDATLIGADTDSDIALLRIQAEDHMVPAEIGDSSQLVVGEGVVAIGNPVSTELSGSVTDGIISALGRKLSDDNTINYIQTNAAINPGNSGGALVNEYGQVIGINTMKVAGTGYEGIGFAIPMAEAIPIVEELRTYGYVASRPVLGIVGAVITETDARDLDAPPGIMVIEVRPDASFDPEVLPQDIITHVAGERILGLSDLKLILHDYEIGDTVELTVYRKTDTVTHEEFTTTVVLVAPEE